MKNRFFKYSLILFLFSSLCYSQDGNPYSPPSGENEDEQPPAPIDNWEGLLVLVAGSTGIYFLTREKKRVQV